MSRKIIVLGSTGSIGRATLDVIAERRGDFEVVGLACRENVELLNRQIEEFRPALSCVYDGDVRRGVLHGHGRVLAGVDGIREMVRGEGDIVVNALPGSSGLEATVETLRQGKVLALANKESLVMAGRLVRRLVRDLGARLIPVDSEHSALYQLLACVPAGEVRNIFITASGGPFREFSLEEMEGVSPQEALNHPTWKMGQKVTLDSATLMNKGLEVIEARWLFEMEPGRIRVVIHPESILHGIVEMTDGALMAHMAYPDMRIPISYALSGEERRAVPVNPLNLEALGRLTFQAPDPARFPSLRLAYGALSDGDSATITLNAANEVATDAFVAGRIRFTDIAGLVERVLSGHPGIAVVDDLERIWEIHRWAREYTYHVMREEYD